MKVVCTNNSGTGYTKDDRSVPMNRLLTVGKEYRVLRSELGEYTVRDDRGEVAVFDAERFRQG